MIEVCLKNVRFSLNSYRFWFEHVLKKLIVEVLQMHCSELHVFIHSVKSWFYKPFHSQIKL